MFKRKVRNWYVPKGQEPTDFDKKILSYQNRGELVPTRNLIKTPEQIEGIKRSCEVNTGVLDLVQQEIHAGMSTEDIDKLVYDYTIAHGALQQNLHLLAKLKTQSGRDLNGLDLSFGHAAKRRSVAACARILSDELHCY